MEQQRFPENEILRLNSETKFKIQNQLLAYIIGYLEDHLEGYHAELRKMTVHENPYALFVIEELSEKFAVWFDGFCFENKTDDGISRRPLTVNTFMDRYHEKPEKVLEEVIAHLGYQSTEEYLRELEEWFKVRPASDESQSVPGDSMSLILRGGLTIPLASRMTRERVMALVEITRSKSA